MNQSKVAHEAAVGAVFANQFNFLPPGPPSPPTNAEEQADRRRSRRRR